MLAHTYDDPPTKHQSKYFETVQADLVRKYGPAKGQRLAERYWTIRNLSDPMFEEEKIKIMYGLA
jgi:hypothetical protein